MGGYALLSAALAYYLFGLGRYNGRDYAVYVEAVMRWAEGLSAYDYTVPTSFHYMPCVLPLFQAFGIFALGVQHGLVLLLSFAALLRMTDILLGLFAPTEFRNARAWGFFALTPWVWVAFGLGAQFESGNINLLLVYLCVEGAAQVRCGFPHLGFLLLVLPALFKPQFGVVGYFIWLTQPRRHAPAFGFALLAAVVFLATPWLWAGNAAVGLYRDWWFSNRAHAHSLLTLHEVAENYSLLSFAVDRLGISVEYAGALLVLCFALFHARVWTERDEARMLVQALLFSFFFFPASFPYSTVSFLPAVVSLLARQTDKRTPRNYRAAVSFWIFALGNILLSVDILGRSLYQTWVIPWRLRSWISLALFR